MKEMEKWKVLSDRGSPIVPFPVRERGGKRKEKGWRLQNGISPKQCAQLKGKLEHKE